MNFYVDDSTNKTIIRHLKGIVAALEKDKQPDIIHYKGIALPECSDEEITEAWGVWGNDEDSRWLPNYFEFDRQLRLELKKRNIAI